MRPEAAPQEVLRPSAAAPFGRSTAASEQTRTAYRRTATDSHAEKSGRGAGGAGLAGGRFVSGAAAFGRSTAGSLSQQTCLMWTEQLDIIA